MTPPTEPVRARWILGGLALALIVVLGLATASGAVSIPLAALPRLLGGQAGPDDTLWHNIIWDIRLPRVLFALVTGAALAICGATMQALFRNPLAEPGLVGISLGGALGAVAAIVLGAGGFFLTASAAFAGSLAATACAYTLGRRVQGVAGLLLAGIAINAVCGALIGLLTFIASDAQLRDLTFWNMGSLAGARWPILAFLAPWTLFWCLWLMRQWRALNALLLGEREAQHLALRCRACAASSSSSPPWWWGRWSRRPAASVLSAWSCPTWCAWRWAPTTAGCCRPASSPARWRWPWPTGWRASWSCPPSCPSAW